MSGKQKVAAVRCARYDQELIGKQLNLLMTAIGADTLIQPGMNVLIKPNLLSAKTPEEFTTTHPEVLRALIRYVHNRGGIVTLAAQGDLIIGCCRVKSHSYTVASGAVKNMFGVIPGLVKAQMHARLAKRESFCRFLCQLCANVKPGLCLMDAIEGMQGNGPSGGERYDGQRLLAAKDPFALDYGALKLFGVEPDWTPVHRRSDFRLPETMKGLIQLIPSPLAALRRHFAPYPKPDPSRCLGCGECVRDCPVQAMTLTEHKAVVDRRRCIRCYCCQEVCPVHVVQIKR